MAVPESAVLVDNSTYFSFRQLCNGGRLDADSVYNAATFVECLVTADEIVTAPTLAWTPTSEDSLFSGDGPCRQRLAEEFTNAELSALFHAAVVAATQDLQSSSLKYPGAKQADVQAAHVILRAWEREAADDPRSFLEVYSGAVFETDIASRSFVGQLGTAVEKDAPVARHLSQFLLRTNVALELVGRDKRAVSYHPHSFRTVHVLQKLADFQKGAAAQAISILRATEVSTREIQDFISQTEISQFGICQRLGDAGPLVLAVAMSGSTTPDEIVKNALELRNSRKARRFRKWTSKLLRHTWKGKQAVGEAEQELVEAKKALSEELWKLSGLTRRDSLRGVSTFLGSIDPKDLFAPEPASMGVSAVLKAVEKIIPGIPAFKARRRVAFVVNLLKRQASSSDLDLLLDRVFRRQFTDADRARFEQLRKEQNLALTGLRPVMRPKLRV